MLRKVLLLVGVAGTDVGQIGALPGGNIPAFETVGEDEAV